MSTENVHDKKRKCPNFDSNKQKRNRRQPQRIYQVKAVEVSPGNYHYFGKIYNSKVEKRLESDWLEKNHLGVNWSKIHLRGRKNKKLGTWVRLPIGRSVAGTL